MHISKYFLCLLALLISFNSYGFKRKKKRYKVVWEMWNDQTGETLGSGETEVRPKAIDVALKSICFNFYFYTYWDQKSRAIFETEIDSETVKLTERKQTGYIVKGKCRSKPIRYGFWVWRQEIIEEE